MGNTPFDSYSSTAGQRLKRCLFDTRVLCLLQVKASSDALEHLSDDGRTLVDEPIRTVAAPDGTTRVNYTFSSLEK